jgi:hypothetical protein
MHFADGTGSSRLRWTGYLCRNSTLWVTDWLVLVLARWKLVMLITGVAETTGAEWSRSLITIGKLYSNSKGSNDWKIRRCSSRLFGSSRFTNGRLCMVITIMRKKGTPNELEGWSLVRLVKILLTSEWIDKAAVQLFGAGIIISKTTWIRALLYYYL